MFNPQKNAIYSEQQAWLERKLENIAQLEWVDITNNPPIYFKKQNVAGKM